MTSPASLDYLGLEDPRCVNLQRNLGCTASFHGGSEVLAPTASAVPKVRVNGRSEDVIFFDGVFFESSLKSIFFAS